MSVQFRHPKDMKKKEEKVPVSTRLRKTSRDCLEKSAKLHGLSLSELVEQILEDYKKWLESQTRK